MISKQILNLITKYLNRQATLLERDELEKWLENPKNYDSFKGYVKINYLIDLNMDLFNADNSKKELLDIINKEKGEHVFKKYAKTMRYVAIAILFLGIGYLYQQGVFSKSDKIVVPNESITLELENGTVEIINEADFKKIMDNKGNVVGSQNGSKLVYGSATENKELAYNTITVPYGKRFELKLSDGTNVYLNSGSSLKYPVKFIQGENREVFSKGQVYFDVTKDANHPFIVNTENIGVRVLGTEFSVSSYPEDNEISTVLVEGSVSIFDNKETYNSNSATLLEPGFKADWNKNSLNLKIEKADIEMQTAWIYGKLVFKHMPFDNMIKKLERHYNVEITNNNKALGKDLITASFDIESIEEVFKVINEIHQIDYTINSNKIIIN